MASWPTPPCGATSPTSAGPSAPVWPAASSFPTRCLWSIAARPEATALPSGERMGRRGAGDESATRPRPAGTPGLCCDRGEEDEMSQANANTSTAALQLPAADELEKRLAAARQEASALR